MLLRYLNGLNGARIVLWCYFLWYLSSVARCFDPSPRVWLTSLGLSAIIGFGLLLSTTHSGTQRTPLGRWQTIRLFLMPFCVSSFAALVKDRGYILVLSPRLEDNLIGTALCGGFGLLVWLAKRNTASAPATVSRSL